MIKPGATIKSSLTGEIIELTGKETIESACGGEFKIEESTRWMDWNNVEPARIRFLNNESISLQSIEEWRLVD